MQKSALYTAAVVFAAVSAAHWLRLVLQAEVVIGGASLSQWLSVVAGIVSALLAAWMVVAARRS